MNLTVGRFLFVHAIFASAATVALAAPRAQAESDRLLQGFQTPPAAARPRVWWHWMNGNVTQEGIRRDLEWMKRVGIGGLDAIDASLATPQIVDKRLVYMSPEWKDAFVYSAQLADELGLEMVINGSPGWSETGGPWVQPHQAMKKLVWTATGVKGGQAFKGKLAQPSAITGPFQHVPLVIRPGSEGEDKPPPNFYADSAVIAYRLREDVSTSPAAKLTSSSGPLDAALLSDGDLVRSLSIDADKGMAWIQFSYDRPRTVRSAVMGTPAPLSGTWGNLSPPVISGQLEAEGEGGWRPVATLNIANVPQVTASFMPVTAKNFRVTFSRADMQMPAFPPWFDTSIYGDLSSRATKPFVLSELSLHADARVNEFERKAGFAGVDDYYALAAPENASDAAVSTADVVDLTAKMQPDGSLDWTPPPGRWTVLRMGYSLTGMTNHPATPEATGLEVDKLNRRHVEDYMKHYLDTYSSFLPSALFGARGLRSVLVDSTEVGPQNWTDDMLAQFKQRRGYDARPWLPALTGVVIASAAKSEKFLWDFRKTYSELMADNHYGALAATARARGLKVYGEAIENKRQIFGDDMDMRRHTDVPMGAMWTFETYKNAFSPYLDKAPQLTFIADDRGAASVAHVHGQNIAAAESLTACGPVPFAFGPRDLKPVADLEFALGINLIFVHTSTHQPNEQGPGVTLGPCGQHFNRHETWAAQAGAWVSYLSRTSYLLQQGRFAADVAYFYGEEAPLTILQERGRLNDAPQSYAFDFVNAQALLDVMTIRDGHLVTPSGMRYRLLQLGGASEKMTLPVLAKIREFVLQGGTVVGKAPEESPSLADDAAKLQQLKMELWGSDGKGAKLGRGRVYGTGAVEEALAAEGVAPDFTYSRPQADTALLFVHRKLDDGDVYFLSNRNNREESVEASFRVSGKTPELWHAETGATERVSFRIENGRTFVPLKLKPFDAVFVVFRTPTDKSAVTVPEPVTKQVAEIKGPWSIAFQENRGAPAFITQDKLSSWTESANSGVKYFSGTATYKKTIEAPKAWFQSGSRLILDLGEVKEVAEVFLNGQSVGIVWNPPFSIDVTHALRRGANTLEVKVSNLWVNRLIGDQQPGAIKYTFTTGRNYTATAPLQPSGLLGPVSVMRQTIATAN